jgi:glycosyltransferase involved in cell wall biosynthesis
MDEVLTGMTGPRVSVVMPVHNAERYLREAIDSILSQTFADFELLVIDDGSTDSSRQIAGSYNDPRMRRLPNERNEGLVATLNRGVALARGEYIAIMHADDVSLPQRLDVQVRFLDAHQAVALIAAKTLLIDSSGNEVGFWPADQSVTSFGQIRATLPRTNCISHPSVMIRREVVLSHRYDERHYATEDYDLWLRLVAEGCRIEKVDEILLKYRVHPASITGKSHDDYKEVRARAKFLTGTIRRGRGRGMNSFHLQVLMALVGDFIKISSNYSKVRLLAIARAICIAVGKVVGSTAPLFFSSRCRAIFFFPFSLEHIGGSERVHADIVAANRHRAPWVILANEWHREVARPVQQAGFSVTDISPRLRNPFTKNLAVGFLAGQINRLKPVLFGGNCEFFYLLLPHLHPQIYCVDIIHAFDVIMNSISLPHVTRINRRIVLAEELRCALASLYRRHQIPEMYAGRIELITYGVEVPAVPPERDLDGLLRVLYVGRGSAEKRVHLVGHIARVLADKGLQVRVSLVGNVLGSVAVGDRPYCTFLGEIHDREMLNQQYKQADLLVITSISEGVSLVKMEAMAFGVVPVATAVGGIPAHIADGETGFLVRPDQEEWALVRDFCTIIEDLVHNRDKLRAVSRLAHLYAKDHFDRSRTVSSLKSLLEDNR